MRAERLRRRELVPEGDVANGVDHRFDVQEPVVNVDSPGSTSTPASSTMPSTFGERPAPHRWLDQLRLRHLRRRSPRLLISATLN